MIIDATNAVLGKIATKIAKMLLLGEKVDLVNCENVIITGNKKWILNEFKQRRARGTPSKGPFYPRYPHMIVKRTIRGMLPYKKNRGREAFKRLKCYVGVPEEFKDKKIEVIKDVLKKPNIIRYMTLKEISKHLGAKI